MGSELKTCPFCGHEPEIMPWHGGGPDKHFVGCSWGEFLPPHGCPVCPQTTGETKAEAIASWNTRARASTGANNHD